MTFKEYIKFNHIETYTEKLFINHNGLTDLYGIENFRDLKVIQVSNNKIVDLDPIKYLINVEQLFISNNLITNIEPLECLYQLEELYLDNNLITDFTPLKYLNTLNEFSCINNKNYKGIEHVKSHMFMIEKYWIVGEKNQKEALKNYTRKSKINFLLNENI